MIPNAIRREYINALKSHSAQIWGATASLCRKTLEGIVVTESGGQTTGSLAKMLRELPDKVDLGKPITSLADSVRLGGNIGTHFDADFEPDEKMASSMLDLIEYMLEYFYAIPRLVEQAKAIIDRPTESESETPDA